jgi:hypothetical protein
MLLHMKSWPNLRASRAFLAMAICLGLSATLAARASDKEAILTACADQFGAAVDAQQNLFSINRFYVLSANFNSRGQLEELAILPRYFFEQSHPNWRAPKDFACLSKSESDELLTRLERIRPKGRLVLDLSGLNTMTYSTAWYFRGYEHATLTWGEGRGDNGQIEVRLLRLEFRNAKLN